MENFAKQNEILFILNENIDGFEEGDVISITTLLKIMVTYAQVSVTVISIV